MATIFHRNVTQTAVSPVDDSNLVTLNTGIQLKDLVNVDPAEIKDEVEISNQCIIDEDDDDSYDRGPCVRCMEAIEMQIGRVYAPIQPLVDRAYTILPLLLYMAYFSYCMYYRFGDEGSIVLLVGTAMFVVYLCKKRFLTPSRTSRFAERMTFTLSSKEGRKCRMIIRYGLYCVTTVGLAFMLGFGVLKDNPQNSQSLIGIAVIILVSLLFSQKPSRINWHPVFWGFIIQFAFAILTLRTDFGYNAFKWIGDVVQRLVDFSDDGSRFVLGKDFRGMGLAFSIAGVIIFFNTIIFLLTHWGVMEVIVIKMGAFLGFCLETGPVESVNAVANIFMGYFEVGMLLRPYMPTLSKSELCAVMTAGFSSVSGGILGMFIVFGAPANHLLTAAVISAPAALALSKIIYPEMERVNVSQQTNMKLNDDTNKSRNALSACADGAVMAAKLITPIVANLLAFLSLMSMINAMLDWFGRRAGIDGLTFDVICSYLLYPMSYVMGAAPEDCGRLGALIGMKIFITPVVGYAELGKLIKNRRILETYIANDNGTWHWSGNDILLEALNTTLVNGVMSERTEVIATYALCGFSAITSIAICIGSMTAVCPSRKKDIVQVVLTAFFAGNMACFATGAVAGVMYTEHSSIHAA